MADVGKENSARQLTKGRSNDTSPQFSPHSKSVAFLSDQTMVGTQTVWSLSLETEEAFQITPSDHEKAVSKFCRSPDRKHIVFLGADELTPEQKTKKEKKDDPQVYGENWEFN
jgi:Tol biopolymer transport system component